ncbi:MAG: hypothetical protein ACFCU8_10490 [Thermosynechococcaceae cyanobacterium]
MKKKPTIAFDCGTSGSKVFASYARAKGFPVDEDRFYLIAPFARELSQARYQTLLEVAEDGIGGYDDCLISFFDPVKEEQVYWQLGQSAAQQGDLPVRDRKMERCVAKLLAFIGYLVNIEIKSEELVEIHLGVLLPFDEIQDRQILAGLIQKVLAKDSGFHFNGNPLSNVRLASLSVKPEGYGIYERYASDVTNILVVGHSDSSWLHFTPGGLSGKQSQTLPETGMHDFIQEVKTGFAITNELQASELINKAGRNLSEKPLLKLTQTRGGAELKQLKDAISAAREQYWLDRSVNFQRLDTSMVDRVHITGGTAQYFADEISALFRAKGVKPMWCKDLMVEFLERYQLKKNTALHCRMVDCYGFYLSLPGVEPFVTKTVETKTVEVVNV